METHVGMIRFLMIHWGIQTINRSERRQEKMDLYPFKITANACIKKNGREGASSSMNDNFDTKAALLHYFWSDCIAIGTTSCALPNPQAIPIPKETVKEKTQQIQALSLYNPWI
jgi:hypothetical protein